MSAGPGTALRRILRLADDGSFEAHEPEPGSATVSGTIRIAGRKVYVTATEPDPAAEPFDGRALIRARIRLLETVAAQPAPLVTLVDSPGKWKAAEGQTLIPDHADEMHAHRQGVGRMYCLQARLGGLAPRISVLLGRTGAANSFPMALSDAVVMTAGAGVSIGRPDAVRTMIGQAVDYETLAGAHMHCTVSGVGDALADNEDAALEWTARWLSFFPDRAGGRTPATDPAEPASADPPDGIVPADPARAYDMRRLIGTFTDGGTLLEIQELHAREIVTALARVQGRCAGIVASNPVFRGGAVFPETCRKMIRFISTCNAFGIPLVFLADTPGFMVGREVEQGGIVKAGADLFSAIAQARVPRMCIVVRKAHTAGLYAMAGPGFEPAAFLALPTASITVFGPTALDRFVSNRELTGQGRENLAAMINDASHPEELVRRGLIDGLIGWTELRPKVAGFLRNCG